MPPRDVDETNARLAAIEQVIAAQSEAHRVLGSDLAKINDKLNIVEDVQEAWREQRAMRVVRSQIMESIKWAVVVVGGIIAGIVGYFQLHAGR